MQNKNILFGIIGLAVVVLVGYGLMSSSGDKKEMMMKDDSMMMKDKEAMMQKDAMEKEVMMEGEMMEKDGAMEKTSMTKETSVAATPAETMMKKEEAMVKAGTYSTYSSSKVVENTNGKNILFFHAAWCPTCKAADVAILGSLAAIPRGVQILKVDYDTSADLKQKYGVTYQHTFVQVDASGNMLAKWSGSRNVEDIVSKLK